MKKCPKCGHSVKDSTTFCGNCGAKLLGGRFLKSKPRKSRQRTILAILVVPIILIALLFTVISFLGKLNKSVDRNIPQLSDQISPEKTALYEKVSTSNIETVQENNLLYLRTQVSIPDYSKYIMDVYVQAAESSSDEDDFERLLYSLVLERTATVEDKVIHDVEVNLSELFPNKDTWTDQELHDIAVKTAFDMELEEFAAFYMIQYSPWLEEVAE